MKKQTKPAPKKGRPFLPEGKRLVPYTFRISPENLTFLKSLPGSAGELINRLLDLERKA